MEQILPALLPAVFALFLIAERLAPGRPQPEVRGWLAKGLAFFVIAGSLATLVPAVLSRVLGQHALLDAAALPAPLGALLLLLVVSVVNYWWHRARHASPLLWRAFHQMHHSAERLDVAGAFYFHPLDVIALFTLKSLLLAFVLHVSPAAAALSGFASFVMTCFTHLNVRTPRVLGYFVARPESHALHHERGAHGGNYSDLPVIDMIFGTFRNPATFEGEVGFYDGASSRMLEMLAFQDVSAPPGEGKPRALDVARAA